MESTLGMEDNEDLVGCVLGSTLFLELMGYYPLFPKPVGDLCCYLTLFGGMLLFNQGYRHTRS